MTTTASEGRRCKRPRANSFKASVALRLNSNQRENDDMGYPPHGNRGQRGACPNNRWLKA